MHTKANLLRKRVTVHIFYFELRTSQVESALHFICIIYYILVTTKLSTHLHTSICTVHTSICSYLNLKLGILQILYSDLAKDVVDPPSFDNKRAKEEGESQ